MNDDDALVAYLEDGGQDRLADSGSNAPIVVGNDMHNDSFAVSGIGDERNGDRPPYIIALGVLDGIAVDGEVRAAGEHFLQDHA